MMVSFKCLLATTWIYWGRVSTEKLFWIKLFCGHVWNGELSLLLIDVGRTSPLWAAPFPGQELNYIEQEELKTRAERVNWQNWQHGCIHFSLSLTVDVM